MTGLLVSAWRLVLKRAASDRLVVAAAFVTVLLTATLLAAGPIYSEGVALSGLRRTLADGPAQERGLQVSARVHAEAYASASARVTREVMSTLGSGSRVYKSAMSDSFAVPAREGRPRDALAVFAFYDGISDHAQLVSGRWPKAGGGAGVEAVLSTSAASRLALTAGDELALASSSDSSHRISVKIVGTYQVDEASDLFWWTSPLETLGEQRINFTTYGPFVVTRTTFFAAVAPEAEARWRGALRTSDVAVGDIGGLRKRLDTLDARLAGNAAPNYIVSGGLEPVLDKADRSLLVARSGVLIPSIQLGILAAAALLFLAGLLAERRALESAVIRSRGAGGDKIALLAMMEGALLAFPAAAIAPWLAALSLRALNHFGPLASINLDLHARVSRESYVLALLAALASIAALGLPALRSGAVTLSVAERGRPPSKGLFQRAGLDLGLAAVALIAYWQLHHYGGPVVDTIQGRLGVDPFLIAAPALGLLAGAVLALRIVPAAAAVVERVAAAARGIVPTLGTRDLARRPQRYARSALLLTLALAIGLFAASYSRTWLHSQHDQADYATGADVLVHPSKRSGSIPAMALMEAYGRVPGVHEALPVLTQPFELTSSSGESSVIAIDAVRAPHVLHFRPDLADRPLADVLAPLAARRPTAATIPLPGRPVRIELDTRIEGDRRLIRQRVSAFFSFFVHPSLFLVVQDRQGLLYRLSGGPLTADGRTRPTIFNLSERLSDGTRGVPAYPLGIVAIELQTRLAFEDPLAGTLTVARVKTSPAQAGPFTDIPPPKAHWTVDVPTPENLLQAPEVRAVKARERGLYSLDFSTGSWTGFSEPPPVTFAATPGRNPALQAIAAVATDGFRDRTGTGIGQSIPLAAGGRGRTLAVTGLVHGFPTVSNQSAAVLVDLPTYLLVKYLSDGSVFEPSEWWIAAAGGRSSAVGHRLVEQPYASAEVADRVARSHALANDPVAVGISGALLLGFAAAAVFAIVGFAVSAAVSAAERATEFAVLRSVGLSARQLSASLALEGALVIALALGAGTALGAGLAWFVLPFVSLTGEGGRPFPEVLVAFPWKTALWLEGGLLAALVVVVVVELHVLGRMRLAPALRTGEGR